MMTNIDVKLETLIITVFLEKSFTISIYLCSSAFLIKWELKLIRLRCEVCQNLILSPMDTGPLRPAVATVPYRLRY